MKNEQGPYGILIPRLHFESPRTTAHGADDINSFTLAATCHLLEMHPPQKDPKTGKPRSEALDTHQIIAKQLKAAMK